MRVDMGEALRYLGVRGEPDEATLSLIEECAPRLIRAAAFKHAALELPVRMEAQTAVFPGFSVHSRALARHLTGCSGALLFAATLGAGVDRLMRECAATGLAEAAALQACAAALIEDACDETQAEYAKQYAAQGICLRPRFSPGYGDFSLSHQPDMLRMLDAQKRIGLFCTKEHMLTPTKSVTAVIGLSALPDGGGTGCAACGKADCTFRKNT